MLVNASTELRSSSRAAQTSALPSLGEVVVLPSAPLAVVSDAVVVSDEVVSDAVVVSDEVVAEPLASLLSSLPHASGTISSAPAIAAVASRDQDRRARGAGVGV